MGETTSAPRVGLGEIARRWTRIGVTGFGGPPAHIALLRRLCVEDRGWMSAADFEQAIAAVNLLPGPASTQLAIYCAWRLRRVRGALVGGLGFITPAVVAMIALSAVFFAHHPPQWVSAAAAGAGAVVPVVALRAGASLAPSSWRRVGVTTTARLRWVLYAVAGALGAALAGPFLVVVLIIAGLVEVGLARAVEGSGRSVGVFLAAAPAVGGLVALAWVALKVGALSYGGGFVIVPLMQHDAVTTYHWMTGAQFLSAVALGQVTPGPVVATVAAVGYAAGGVGGGLLAAAIAFAPSFGFVLAGGPHLERLRDSAAARAFLTGAGAAAIGAILGSSIPLARELSHLWQIGVLAVGALWLLVARRGIVTALLGAAALGVVAVAAGGPLR